MAWPAIIAGAAALGSAAMSSSAQNSAMDASTGAAKAQAQNAMMQQWYQQMQQEQYQKPYAEMGLNNLPLLEYLTTGARPANTALTPEELAELNRYRGVSGPQPEGGYGGGGLSGALADQAFGVKQRAASQWDNMSYDDLMSARRMYSSSATGNRRNQRMYGGFVTDIDKQLARYNELENKERQANAYNRIQDGSLLQESPLYRWQQERGEQSINRAMAARGQYGSSAATNSLSNFNRALGAEETERQYGRIAGLVSQGQTGVNNYMASGQQTGNSLANLQMNLGNTLSNNALQQGNQRANLYNQTAGNMVNAYSLYQMNQNNNPSARSSYDWASGEYK